MVESLWTPITYIFGLIRCQVGVQIGGRQFQVGDHIYILSTGRASTSERSCDLERDRNIVNVTVELSSFGRPKKEKLEPHLRPLREATAPT
ncbi:hypothetical protein Taro_014183 [Colocasia esculenta]|uniref:Uncharacterized protein n=1 Tax=Colocasia esculenta TaxID=4460 RepID=A0A843UL22_COLES|nr:hypothetical protein [Colocasia esculenta]